MLLMLALKALAKTSVKLQLRSLRWSKSFMIFFFKSGLLDVRLDHSGFNDKLKSFMAIYIQSELLERIANCCRTQDLHSLMVRL